MAGGKILVFGATGPAGICLLRELLHRNLPAIAYCRSPFKIPADLTSNSLLEVVKGDMSDRTALSEAVSKSQAVISLLGPSTKSQPKDTFANYYRTIIPLMKQHGVHRILVLGTTAIYQPKDQSSISRALMCNLIKLIANSGYQNTMAVQDYFESIKNDTSFQWTVFRLGMLSGTCDQAEWSSGRDCGKIFDGPVGAPGFTGGINRSLLARWLVDTATANPETHVRSMPVVSKSG